MISSSPKRVNSSSHASVTVEPIRAGREEDIMFFQVGSNSSHSEVNILLCSVGRVLERQFKDCYNIPHYSNIVAGYTTSEICDAAIDLNLFTW